MSLALWNPQYRAALGAFEEAVEIFLPLFFPVAEAQLGQRGNQGQESLVFGPATCNIPTENPKIAEDQAEKRQKPEHRTDGTASKHGDNQQHTGGKTGGHRKGVWAVSPSEKWLFSSHIAHLPFRFF